MHLFPSTKIFVSFGSFEIAWYAVLILTGALCAYLLCQRTMKKWGYAPEVLDDYVVPMLFIGILGARAWYVIFEWQYYSQHMNEIVAITCTSIWSLGKLYESRSLWWNCT